MADDNTPKSIRVAHRFVIGFVGLNIMWMFVRKAMTNQTVIGGGEDTN